ncbi:unnamed protein product [Schistocephalus solidus]|uniref:Reverse transcriptase domain-containing protein n=1 Tax=Schistocephalus solidus TaxID=70667 RepID=A0A183S9Q1_SCHSO|nr:unnamed protein product [Schistocephalus solidus]
MSSPISGLLAELVLQRLEEAVAQTLGLTMWLHHVDDTFVVINNCEVERLHQRLNGVFPAIQLTREGAKSDILPFPEVVVQRLSDGNLATSVHRKDSNAEIILNYGSNHTAAHKRSCVRAIFHRAFRTEVVAMASTKQAREFLEAWPSETNSINRHVELDAHYEGLRARSTDLRPP